MKIRFLGHTGNSMESEDYLDKWAVTPQNARFLQISDTEILHLVLRGVDLIKQGSAPLEAQKENARELLKSETEELKQQIASAEMREQLATKGARDAIEKYEALLEELRLVRDQMKEINERIDAKVREKIALEAAIEARIKRITSRLLHRFREAVERETVPERDTRTNLLALTDAWFKMDLTQEEPEGEPSKEPEAASAVKTVEEKPKRRAWRIFGGDG